MKYLKMSCVKSERLILSVLYYSSPSCPDSIQCEKEHYSCSSVGLEQVFFFWFFFSFSFKTSDHKGLVFSHYFVLSTWEPAASRHCSMDS